MSANSGKDLLATVGRRVRARLPFFVRERLYDWDPARRRQWREAPGLTQLRGTSNVALTFDDGPDPVWTPAVLGTLADHGATATFFVIGDLVDQYPEVARSIVAGGHEIALHGMEHRRHDLLDPTEMREELTGCAEAIERACGVSSSHYRPPYGAIGAAGAAICNELGFELTYWSAWGQDWDSIGPDRIARLVRRDLEPGAIVLLHDAALFAPRADAAATVSAIPTIAADAAARDLKLTSIATARGRGDRSQAVAPTRQSVAVSRRAHA